VEKYIGFGYQKYLKVYFDNSKFLSVGFYFFVESVYCQSSTDTIDNFYVIE